MSEDMSSADKFRKSIKENGFVAFSSSGMSMYPFLKSRRDVSVVVKITEKPKKYDVILYEDEFHRLVLHRIIKSQDTRAYIRGDNCKSGEWVDESNYIGILSEFTRKGKDGKVSDIRFAVYSRIAVFLHPLVKLRISLSEWSYKTYRKLFGKK